MGFTEVKFDLQGEAQYSRAFEMAASEARDLSEPLRETGEIVRESVEQQFDTEGRRSSRWQLLNRAYEAWKRSRFGGGPILVATGKLRHEATSRRAVSVSPRRMVYEIDDPKALYHHTGAGRLPARKIINLTGQDRRGIDRAFAGWLNELRRGIIRAR